MIAKMKKNAQNSLELAKSLVAQGTEHSLRYASLELRFAIEFLVYGLLSCYKDEVDEGVARKWTPRKVLSEILAIDPCGDSSSKLFYGVEIEHGKQSEELTFLGEEVRFDIRWANANHNALGSFLHAPTLEQIEMMKCPTIEKMTKKANEVIVFLEKVLSSSVFGVTLGTFYSLACDCGREIKRRKGSFNKEDGIKCPDCQAIWDIVSEESDEDVLFLIRKIPYCCPVCEEENFLPVQLAKEGLIVSCGHGHHSKIVLALRPMDSELSKC